MSDFTFAESERDGVAHFALKGDLDMSATFRLEPALDRLLDGGAREVVLDMREVPFVDSSGLGLLIASHERATQAGIPLAIAGSGPEIRRVFELAGVDDMLPLVPG